MLMKNIAIIGGGASGLMAALTAAKAGAAVTLYEHNKSVGKKILASGNGRCNIINTTASSADYFGADPSFVNHALEAMNFHSFEKFCLSIGLLLDIKEDGRCYPLSNEARSVVHALQNAVSHAGVTIHTEMKIESIESHKDGFILNHTAEHYYDKVLIATGSQAAPQLGATDDGHTWAKAFGHTIETPYPSLVQLHLDSESAPKMAGVKIHAEVTLYLNGKPEERSLGDTLFTRYGISGLTVLDLSQKASFALTEYQAVSIGINLLPRFSRQALAVLLEKLFSAITDYALIDALNGLLSTKIIPHLLQSAKLSPQTPVQTLNTKQIKKLAHHIQDWRFDVTQTHGFKHAEVSGGGVSTLEVDPKSMESKLVKGVYFSGEVLDIVGKRGGYNFNFAWASGMIAGKELAH